MGHFYNGLCQQPALWGVTNRVKKMVTPYRSPVKLEVARDGTPATALGGLVVLLELLAATRVLAALPEAEGSPSQGWSDGQMIRKRYLSPTSRSGLTDGICGRSG